MEKRLLNIPDKWYVAFKAPDKTYTTYQHRDRSSLFKDVFHETKTVEFHDIDRYRLLKLVDDSDYRKEFYNGFIVKILDGYFPITFPYEPIDHEYTVFCSDILYDPGNGDFDTLAIWHAEKGNEVIAISRFFKEGKSGWEEIDYSEWCRREKIHKQREGKYGG